MKHTLFKTFAAGVSGILCALALASCSIIDSGDSIDTSGTAATNTAQAQNGLVTLRIAVNEKDIRTAYPQIEALSSFTGFALTCDGKTIGKWKTATSDGLSAYQVMNNDSVTVTAGAHDFVLTGTETGGAQYAGAISQSVSEDTVLSFTLNFSGVSTSTDSADRGSVAYTVSWPAGTSLTNTVTKVEITYTKYESATSRTLVESSASTVSNTPAATATSLTPTTQSLSGGKYLYEFKFYGGNSGADTTYVLLGSVSEVAYVSKGLTTPISVSIRDFNSVYTITYNNIDGATFTGSYPLYYTWERDVTLPTPAKTGYTFAGWYTALDEDGAGVGTAVTGWSGTSRNENVTLYAAWTPNVYTVRFYTNLHGDAALDATPYDTQTVAHGDFAEEPDTEPTKNGYTFDHWFFEGEEDEADFAGTAITANRTVYAVWSYNVSFNANAGEDAVTGTMAPLTMYNSREQVSSSVLTANAFVRSGYSFLGWATTATATEAAYTDGATVSFEGATTLYAVWHDDSEGIIVRFDPQGGTPVASQVIASGQSATAPTRCTKAGYALGGWYTGTVAEDGTVTLSDTAYDFTAEVTESLTLYASWVRTTYYVSSSGSDSTGDGSVSAPYVSVAKALTTINTAGSADVDYIIAVSGVLSERVSITSSNLTASHARSLTIRGTTGNSTDKLNGSAGGTVLTLSTAVPVTLADIAITNGAANSYAGGIKIDASGAILTLEDGALITGNKATGGWGSRGIGVYINSGTLVMKAGSSISDNNVNISSNGDRGGGVYVASGASFTMDGGVISGNVLPDFDGGDGGAGVFVAGTFTMNGGEISGNRTASSSSGNYGGAGVMVSSGTFTMNGGIIANNVCNGGKGGAVYVDGFFNMSASAYIPYGGSEKNNDVYLASGKYITVIGTLEAPAGGSDWAIPVATITPYSITTGSTTVLTASSDVTLADEAPKFALSNRSYRVGSDGKIYNRTSYAITYKDAGGGSFTGTHQTGYPTSHGVGETTTLLGATKTHYTFDGWYTSSDSGTTLSEEPVTALTDENCTAAITLYAKWTEDEHVTISYRNVGDGTYTGTNASSLVSKHYAGETETLVAAVRSGYVFAGWFIAQDGSGTAVTALTDAICSADLTLYAKWKPHYSVSYADVGGGDFSGTTATTRPSAFNEGESISLPLATKTGYTFLGWFAAEDGSGTAVTALTDETCTDDLTLYAKWKREEVTVTVASITDLAITQNTATEGIIYLGASTGFTGYTWTLEGHDLATIPGFEVSGSGTQVTVTKSSLLTGYDYAVTLRATKDGLPYMTVTTITVTD